MAPGAISVRRKGQPSGSDDLVRSPVRALTSLLKAPILGTMTLGAVASSGSAAVGVQARGGFAVVRCEVSVWVARLAHLAPIPQVSARAGWRRTLSCTSALGPRACELPKGDSLKGTGDNSCAYTLAEPSKEPTSAQESWGSSLLPLPGRGPARDHASRLTLCAHQPKSGDPRANL